MTYILLGDNPGNWGGYKDKERVQGKTRTYRKCVDMKIYEQKPGPKSRALRLTKNFSWIGHQKQSHKKIARSNGLRWIRDHE